MSKTSLEKAREILDDVMGYGIGATPYGKLSKAIYILDRLIAEERAEPAKPDPCDEEAGK
jgi:hypothetical protein